LSSGRIESVLDQGLSSLSNLLLAVLVARYATVREFGLFALATGMYWLFLGVGRSLVGEPRLVVRDDVTRCSGAVDMYASACVAVIASAVFLSLSVVSGVPLFALMALAVFPLLMQDSLRYVFFAQAAPRGALLLDAVWLVAQALTIPVMLFWLDPSIPEYWVGFWALGSCISLLVGVVWQRPGWFPRGLRMRTRLSRRSSVAFLSDYVVMAGAQQLLLLLLPAVTSIGGVAALKTAQVVNGPLTVLINAATVVLLPSFARYREADNFPEAVRLGCRTSAILSACGGVYVVATALVLPRWGDALLGEQWQNSRSIVPLICMQMALMGLSHGAVLLLRGFSCGGPLVLARLAVTPVNIGAPLVGAGLVGASGMAWGMVVAALHAAVVWWITVVTAGGRSRV
jgi:O-antigen/teichoic acid export membrane protein